MHRGRQSNGALRPVLVVWVVHFAKKIDQPPTLGLKAPWLLQERCAAVSREPGVVHAPELRCGVRGRPPGVYQPAPRVYQTLIYTKYNKKFLHEPNPNPQSESFSALGRPLRVRHGTRTTPRSSRRPRVTRRAISLVHASDRTLRCDGRPNFLAPAAGSSIRS